MEVAGEGIGRIGTVKKQTARAFAEHAKQVLGAQGARFCGDPEREITRVAVNTGGGASLCESAIRLGADLFLSGDFSYPQMREYAQRGMCILDIDHYTTEIICRELFEKLLREALGKDCPPLYLSEANTNVMMFI